MAKHKELGTPENNLETFLGQMYEEAGLMDQAEIHYRKACELDSQFNNQLFFAMFLINNGVNVTEGMEIIQKMLEKIPDDEFILQLKGWGLYKQGKYEEALQLLEQMWGKSKEFYFNLYTHLEAVKKAVASQVNN
jgi:tetratricopeptide (TPR) repeat protein